MFVPLTGERWQRLESLFAVALELPSAERLPFVERETGDDTALRSDLTGMLAHADHAPQEIASVIDRVALATAPAGFWIDRRLGAYRITREIGRGGMGVVFEAVRDDDEFRKTVALKIAPVWFDTLVRGERFRLERQILAQLEHPNIARFLDGGTEDGVPYFVMEYVEGVPITAYCRERQLDVRSIVQLFRQVCAAIHFAHESLIVHRDLKPANILVTADGTPKLLDFGIAKLLDPVADPNAGGSTMEAPWTPDYTSPEQVRGRPVTTRTDVYSLGLILYELLTGVRAQIADVSSPLMLDRSICETEPPRPSERATRHARKLRGDLDTIVMTAIQKEPERRYGTAAALSDDLGRYLEGLPIKARPAAAAYRARKFVARHRAGVAAAVLLALTVAAGIAATLYEARRAERRFQQVRALANTFIFDVHDRIQPLPGATEARKAIVQTALTYLESLRADAAGDDALSLELASAYERIGRVQGGYSQANLGDSAGALASYVRGMDLLRPIVRRNDAGAGLSFVRMSMYYAETQFERGDKQKAMSAYVDGEAVGERLLRPGPADAGLLSELVNLYAADARSATRLGQFARALEKSERAMALAGELTDREPANRSYRVSLSTAQNAYGRALIREDRLKEGADQYRASVAIREQLLEEEPGNAEYRRGLQIGYVNLGDVLGYRQGESLGDNAGAVAAFQKAVALARQAGRDDPADRQGWLDIGEDELRLATALWMAGQLTASLAHLNEAEPFIERVREKEAEHYSDALIDASLQQQFGKTLAALGRNDEAARRLEGARRILSKLITSQSGPTPRAAFVSATARLAQLRAAAGDPRAVVLAREAADQLASGSLGRPFLDASSAGMIGAAYLEMAKHGRPDRSARARDGVSSLEKAAALWQKLSVPPEVEAQRQQNLREVEANLAASRRLAEE
jgi:tetratricopeptide (TPR) repeat protein